MLSPVLRQLLAGAELGRDEARAALDRILHEEVPVAQTAAFLTLLQARPLSPAVVAGLADSLLAAAQPFPREPGDAIDTCGTGGDGKGTFNLSTVTALVAAAAGARVLKHGNRAATSRSGSADLLEQLGIPTELAPAQAAAAADQHGFAFLYARQYHPVVAKVAPVRTSIGFPTAFNLLGPLLNPARVTRQVIGVYAAELMRPVAEALVLQGCRRALVLHGAGGLDEATPLGPFRCEVIRDGQRVGEEVRDPAELGLSRCQLSDLQVTGPEQSAAVAREVLSARPGPRQDAVVLATALALEVAGVARDWQDGARRARAALESGQAERLVTALSRGP